MKSWLSFGVFALFILGCFFAIRLWQKTDPKPLVRPPPRSKKPDQSYQSTNTVAKLFVETVALKEARAKWPAVMKSLNPDDEPHIRTLLLELRLPIVSDRGLALKAIERACIDAKRENHCASREDLLENAKTLMLEMLRRQAPQST